MQSNDSLSLMRLMQLVSPALPVGAYAYSQGLEFAVHSSWVSNEDSARDWMRGILINNLAKTDLVIIDRLHVAWSDDDIDAVIHWNHYLLSLRETAELEAEDSQMGQALRKLLTDLNIEKTDLLNTISSCTFATAFTLACVQWGISSRNSRIAYAYSWVENQIAAAIKLIPLGQTSGQRLISILLHDIEQAVAHSEMLEDESIGSSLPALSLASSLHETQYSRLFRS